MKRYQYLRLGLMAIFTMFFISGPAFIASAAPAKQMYYEIKIYRIKDASQAATTDKYLKDAFIPALHRVGISKVGVFKPVETDTAFGKFIYVFIPFKTVDQYLKLITTLENDKVYQQAGKDFLDAPYNNPPFVRYESVFMKAFSFMPQFRVPAFTTPVTERIYELRSYESATEAKALKKIHMFNEGGEIGIFEKIGANAVFYGQVLLGSQKPRLMYMTTYADMKSHDEHWAAFRSHPDWITLRAKEEYQNTTSKTKAFLLHPTDYSDF
ncbi:MAG: NIPSNAP family protein [Bacteroidales bacterium]|nr:NIPSNAP family protein [Bacteroidales bacterium]